MEDLEAAEIIKSLAAGSSPTDVSALLSPDIGRAPFLAAQSLEARPVKHGQLEVEQASAARIR